MSNDIAARRKYFSELIELCKLVDEPAAAEAARILRDSMYDQFQSNEEAFADYLKIHKLKHPGM